MPVDYDIRRARANDVDTLVDLEAHFPTDRLRRANLLRLLARGNADIFVLDRGGKPVANVVTLYRRNSRRARIYSLVVDAAHRGRGLGAVLLDTAESAAARRGCRRIALEVRPDNAGALRLYARRGYAVTGRKTGFYEDGSEALRLDKPLPAA